MKSINTLLSALFFLSAIVGITSCTEEADYTPAQKPENAQVYFATDEHRLFHWKQVSNLLW